MPDNGDEVKTEAPVEPTKEVEKAPVIPTDNDRTKQEFDKLKNSNQELKKERDSYKNVLESLKPSKPAPVVPPNTPSATNYPNLDQNKVNDIARSLVDENGMVDMNKLTSMLVEAQRTAESATREARSAREESKKTVQDFEETTKMREVHKTFPELDPKSDKFSPEYYDSVRNELVGQLLRGEKENVDEAAAKWHTRIFGTKESKEDKRQEKEANEARSVISTTPSGGAKNRYSNADHSDLVKRTRQGDKTALKERLERSGY